MTAVALGAVLPLGFAASAVAEPQSKPNGPWPGENPSSLAAIHSYEELWSTLEPLRAGPRGRSTSRRRR